MPKIEFIPTNVIDTGTDFPKLKLDAQESARIVVLEIPTYVYVHTLRAPEIGTDGKPVMHKVERKGEQVDAFKLGFIGRHQCLGDENTIKEGRGTDPDNCPMCEAAVKSSIVDAPQRRFAVHVAKYATKPGTFDVSKPFSAQIQVWAFTEGIFKTLTGFQDKWGSLLKHDLELGPCTNKDFQKFGIAICPEAEWLKTEKTKNYIKEALEENQCEDLEEFIARRKDKKYILQDIKTVEDRWKTANGQDVVPEVTNDLSGILGKPKAQVVPVGAATETDVAQPVTAKKSVKVDPVVVEPDPEPVVEEIAPATPPVEEEPTSDATEDEPKATPKSLSFDELINNL